MEDEPKPGEGSRATEPLEFDFTLYLARRLGARPEEVDEALGVWMVHRARAASTPKRHGSHVDKS